MSPLEQSLLEQELGELDATLHQVGPLGPQQQGRWRNNINNYYNQQPQSAQTEERRFRAQQLLGTHNRRLQQEQSARSDPKEHYLADAVGAYSEDYLKSLRGYRPREPLNTVDKLYDIWKGLETLEAEDQRLNEQLDRTNVDRAAHCSAHCQARRTGKLAEWTNNLGFGAKEFTLDNNPLDSLRGRRLSPDTYEDLRANRYGLDHAADPGRCSGICEEEYPIDKLDSRYRNNHYLRYRKYDR